MLPGTDNPTDEPIGGGAKFLPGGVQTTNRHEFAMNDQVNINPVDFSIPPLLIRDVARVMASPVSHLHFPQTDGQVRVTGCGPGSPSVDAAAEVLRILQNPAEGCG